MREGRVGALILAALLVSGGAGAAERGAVRAACRADAQRLCTGVEPGQGRIVACLRDKAEQLTPDCRNALRDAAERRTGQGAAGRGGAGDGRPSTDGAATPQ
jgi:hypothetical protein